jgi:Fe(3+) dicitrate transport protein
LLFLREYFQNFLQLFYHPWFSIWKYTQAEGSYRKINLDLAGNVILDENQQENNVKDRNFVLFGVGLSYKPQNQIELYGNSQNYRSVTFNDIRTVSPTWLTPTYPMKRIYFRHWYTWTIRDKVTFDASIRFVL